jgi:hypothetical protein
MNGNNINLISGSSIGDDDIIVNMYMLIIVYKTETYVHYLEESALIKEFEDENNEELWIGIDFYNKFPFGEFEKNKAILFNIKNKKIVVPKFKKSFKVELY